MWWSTILLCKKNNWKQARQIWLCKYGTGPGSHAHESNENLLLFWSHSVKMYWISFHRKCIITFLIQRTPTNPDRLNRFCSLVHLWSLFRCICQRVIAKNILCLNFWNGDWTSKSENKPDFWLFSVTVYLFKIGVICNDADLTDAASFKFEDLFYEFKHLFIKFHTTTSETTYSKCTHCLFGNI